MQVEVDDKEYAVLVLALTARAAELRERAAGIPFPDLTAAARKVWEDEQQIVLAILARLQCP